MFTKIGNTYFNLDQMARVEFTYAPTMQATIYFAKPGGSDRHFLNGEEAKLLEEALQKNEMKKAKK